MPTTVPNFLNNMQTPLGAAFANLAGAMRSGPSEADQISAADKALMLHRQVQGQQSLADRLAHLYQPADQAAPVAAPPVAPPVQLPEAPAGMPSAVPTPRPDPASASPIAAAFASTAPQAAPVAPAAPQSGNPADWGGLLHDAVLGQIDPKVLGGYNLFGTANQFGAKDDRTQNAQVGAGQTYENTFGALDRKQTDNVGNNVRTQETSRANNAATNATSRANNAATIAGENARTEQKNAGQNDPLGLNKFISESAQPGVSAPQSAAHPANNVRDEGFLASLDAQRPGLGGLVKSIADGKTPMVGNYALTKPAGQQLAELVMRYDPSADAANLPGRVALRRSMVAGPMAQNAQSLNTVAQHIGKLAEDSDALGGTSFPAVNAVSNFASAQTGSAKVGNFNTDADAVASELTRSFRGNAGAVSDIESWRANLNPNASPEQRKQAIQHIVGLLGGRIEAVGDTYNKGMGVTEDPYALMSPGARAVFDKFTNGSPSSAPHQTAPAAEEHWVRGPDGKLQRAH